MRKYRKILLTLLGMSLVVSGLSQGLGQIKGEIRDRQTGEPLPFANVFLNNTSIGSPTDQNGKFQLVSCPAGNYDLKVSFIGYETESRRILVVNNETIELYLSLQPQKKSLSEIEIKESRDKKWEKDFKRFEKEFMGTTPNAAYCQIVNPWIVNFEEGTETWEMKASADQPLEVHNLAMGYKLFFYIVQFEIHKTKVIILGDARFELMKPSTPEEEKAWIQKRQETYLGTERHLFNTMILGLAERQGFRIYSERSKKRVSLVRSAYFKRELDKTLIPYTIRIIPFHGKVTLFQIPIRGRLEIHYIHKKDHPFYDDVQDQVSWIETDEEAILVSESGVPQEPAKMILLGFWSEQRAADMLPLDYVPTK